ncbi:MAG TPA: aminotransferase class V-fold PLP-dependent enzyme [Gaiellaceae bacterium]|nr:aminotransferase class V-fold PLP-dependent enzyme [Gaiellaceae bacterium]
MRDLLHETADLAADFLESLPERPVFPSVELEALRARLGGPVPEAPTEPRQVVAELAAAGGEAAVGMAGGRYFGFVIGGALPAALAADWLTSAWDQNAGLYVGGPAASVVEEVAGRWLVELLDLPRARSFAFVTGTQMAHATALAAARNHVLERVGWDVERDGLTGAPRIRVLAGAKAHSTLYRALRLIGLGTGSVDRVEVDDQGRMQADALSEALAEGGGPAIVCAQAGEVNTGAFDSFAEIAAAAAEAGAWLHVDGAFGLWAAASPRFAHLVAGAERADSWSVDAHKWLNVPYDSGIVLCAHPEPHRRAMGAQAEYLVHAETGGPRDQLDWTPEFSRRARGFAVYAAIRSLGRSGIAAMIERCCDHAARFAQEITATGADVLNEVVLNQVLFRYETDERTLEILRRVQESGEAWMSGTVWQERQAIRLSVSNWQTDDRDVDRTLAAFSAAT